jgi:hypothetical protein
MPAPQRELALGLVGTAGTEFTVTVTVDAFADWHVTPPCVVREYTDTSLLPAVAPLTVYVPLPVPLAVPAGLPLHV